LTRTTLLAAAALVVPGTVGTIAVRAQAPASTPPFSRPAGTVERSGAEVFRTACATCHGPDGRGHTQRHVGFDVPIPDFTDCRTTTPEAESDWFAVIYNGGPVRAFARQMPAFGEALTESEIDRVVKHLRTFCGDPGWPPGDLNLPRALVTEKAFPENEALLTTTVRRAGGAAVRSSFVYEHRLGRRTQIEVNVPIEIQRAEGGGVWTRGLGDVALAIKQVLVHSPRSGSILSAGGELLLPTGRHADAFGKGVAIVEPFVAAGQILPSNGFVQSQAGIELPVKTSKSAREAFWRMAAGRTFFQQRFHREWSPMLEFTATKALSAGERVLWDAVPQVQLSLSRRHHVLVNGGLELPINERGGRGRTFRMYVLWDWFDGSLFSGW
jgi:mono/diheme cytochrome c family protein